jgi:RNA polymerase sigma factor (sigma-70 family)
MTTIEFNEMYKTNLNYVRNYIYSKVRGSFNTEEILTQVFIKAWDYADRFDSEKSSIRTFLITITNSCISDYFRKENKHRDVLHIDNFVDDDGNEYIEFDSGVYSDSDINNTELGFEIQKAIDSLKPHYKEIAKLYFIEELKYIEISKVLDIPMSRVKVYIMRCKEQLQKSLSHVKEIYS